MNLQLFGIVHATLTEDFGLVRKSAPWVSKLLSTAQKQERVKCSGSFLDLIPWHSLAVLNNIMMMNELAVAFRTFEMKDSVHAVGEEGPARPSKGLGHDQVQTDGPCLLWSKGVIYMNYIP